jgi:phosphoribosylglycinamide formyltransferase-1
MNKTRTAIFISGRGSNMQALLQAEQDSSYPTQTVVVISNCADAAGLKIAENLNIPVLVFDDKNYKGRRHIQEQHIHKALLMHQVEFVVLAGYMRILTADFVNQWQNRIINIHPSLLPLYPGLHTHERALAAGDQEHGCTIHWVTAELDAGEILAQARVPIWEHDTPNTLAARVLEQEHPLLVDTVRKLCKKTG